MGAAKEGKAFAQDDRDWGCCGYSSLMLPPSSRLGLAGHCFFCCTRPERMTQPRAPTGTARCPAELGPALGVSFEGQDVGKDRRFFGGRGYSLAHCQGLLAHQQSCHPKLLGTRRDLGSLTGYPKIFALDLEPVCDVLEPPARPLCKLFVIHSGCLLQRSSRVLLGAPTLPRAPRCESPQLWPGQQGVERSLGIIACVVRDGSIAS